MNTDKENPDKTITIELSPILVLVIIASAFIAGMMCQGYYDIERGLNVTELSVDAPEYDDSMEAGNEDDGIVNNEDGTLLNDDPLDCGVSA